MARDRCVCPHQGGRHQTSREQVGDALQRVPISGGRDGNSTSSTAILFCFTAGTFILHASPSLQTGVALASTRQLRSQGPMSVHARPLPILLFFCVFSAPFLGRALLQGFLLVTSSYFGRICSHFLLAKMCQLFLFLFCPLDFCSLCGFCSLCAPDTTFADLCTALVAVVFTAFTTSRFMCWVFRCHCACLCEAWSPR